MDNPQRPHEAPEYQEYSQLSPMTALEEPETEGNDCIAPTGGAESAGIDAELAELDFDEAEVQTAEPTAFHEQLGETAARKTVDRQALPADTVPSEPEAATRRAGPARHVGAVTTDNQVHIEQPVEAEPPVAKAGGGEPPATEPPLPPGTGSPEEGPQEGGEENEDPGRRYGHGQARRNIQTMAALGANMYVKRQTAQGRRILERLAGTDMTAEQIAEEMGITTNAVYRAGSRLHSALLDRNPELLDQLEPPSGAPIAPPDTVGGKFKQIAQEKGLIAEVIAERLGVSDRTVHRRYTGDSNMSDETFEAMLDAHGITADDQRQALRDLRAADTAAAQAAASEKISVAYEPGAQRRNIRAMAASPDVVIEGNYTEPTQRVIDKLINTDTSNTEIANQEGMTRVHVQIIQRELHAKLLARYPHLESIIEQPVRLGQPRPEATVMQTEEPAPQVAEQPVEEVAAHPVNPEAYGPGQIRRNLRAIARTEVNYLEGEYAEATQAVITQIMTTGNSFAQIARDHGLGRTRVQNIAKDLHGRLLSRYPQLSEITEPPIGSVIPAAAEGPAATTERPQENQDTPAYLPGQLRKNIHTMIEAGAATATFGYTKTTATVIDMLAHSNLSNQAIADQLGLSPNRVSTIAHQLHDSMVEANPHLAEVLEAPGAPAHVTTSPDQAPQASTLHERRGRNQRNLDAVTAAMAEQGTLGDETILPQSETARQAIHLSQTTRMTTLEIAAQVGMTPGGVSRAIERHVSMAIAAYPQLQDVLEPERELSAPLPGTAAYEANELRLEQGDSALAVAERAGVSVKVAQQFFNGRRMPKPEIVQKLLTAMDLPEAKVDELILNYGDERAAYTHRHVMERRERFLAQRRQEAGVASLEYHQHKSGRVIRTRNLPVTNVPLADMTFGQLLGNIMADAGMTEQEVAQAADISPLTLSHLRSDSHFPDDGATLDKILRVVATPSTRDAVRAIAQPKYTGGYQQQVQRLQRSGKLDTTYGHRLRGMAKARNLTEKDVAQALGVSRSTISKFWRGQGLRDADERLAPMLDYLGATPQERADITQDYTTFRTQQQASSQRRNELRRRARQLTAEVAKSIRQQRRG